MGYHETHVTIISYGYWLSSRLLVYHTLRFMHIAPKGIDKIFFRNFFFFFKWVVSRVSRIGFGDLQKNGIGHGSTRFFFRSKNSGLSQVFFSSGWVESTNFDSFCHIY